MASAPDIFLSQVFENAPVAMSVATASQGHFVAVNKEFERLFGLPADEILGRTSLDIDMWPDPIARENLRDKMRQQGHLRNERILLRTAGGELRNIRLDTRPFTLAGEKLWLSINADETEQERDLQASNDRFRAAFIAGSDAFIISERDTGKIVEVNDRLLSMLGYEKSELVGRSVRDLGFWADPVQRDQFVAKLTKDGSVYDYEVIGKRKSGEQFSALNSAILMSLPGQVPMLMAATRDISEKRKLEDQLRHAQKFEAVAAVAAGLAHDFNNMLTVIVGASDLLVSDPGISEITRDLAKLISAASERAGKLTRQLLVFSRSQALMPTIFNLNTLIGNSKELLSSILGEEITLNLVLDKVLPCIKADTIQMEQVIFNLALNARDAMGGVGNLTIRTRISDLDGSDGVSSPGRYAVLSVCDNGSGMTEEVKAHLFEPFFTTKGVGKGTGLGLATVQRAIWDCGGRISVESSPGLGACFTIYIPACSEMESKISEGHESLRLQGDETVLMIDDDPLVRVLTRNILSRCGYRVLEAVDGEGAERLAAQYKDKIDLVLTDVVMPGIGGRQAAENIKVYHPEARVLFVSGYADDALLRRGIELGLVHFLPKPFTPEQLNRAVRKTLSELT